MSPQVNAYLRQGQVERHTPDNPAALEEFAPCEAGTCSDTPLLAIPWHEPADNDATCEDATTSTHDIDSWARHAFAANGFGEVGFADVASAAWPSSLEVYQDASTQRSRIIAGVIAKAIRAVRAIARRVVAWHRQRQQAKATFDVLHGLDDRTLRDLGFHRSEITSSVTQATGADAYTHALGFWTSQGPLR